MDEHLKQNIIRVLDKAIKAIKEENIIYLKNISNETVHDATVYQDEYSIAVAVLIYSLSKIHEREEHYGKFKGWKMFCSDCFKGLETAKERLISNDIQGFEKIIKQYTINLEKTDRKLKVHIQDVFRKARINKASRLYEHGLSMGRTAELLGITKFELMDYIGKTYIADVRENITINPVERLKFARGLFK
ncbi:hypothetical protein HYU23_04535 [Candidatus Woesearchaeota archaeon]|nr:hypothetical protein [Candidatus Woesearchaeota archaeon]